MTDSTTRDSDPNTVQLVETTDRAAVGHLLKLEGQIDLAIPRGGESLIRAVVEQAHIPVIKHYTGNCHVYVDAAADDQMALDLCVNAKTQRPPACAMQPKRSSSTVTPPNAGCSNVSAKRWLNKR